MAVSSTTIKKTTSKTSSKVATKTTPKKAPAVKAAARKSVPPVPASLAAAAKTLDEITKAAPVKSAGEKAVSAVKTSLGLNLAPDAQKAVKAATKKVATKVAAKKTAATIEKEKAIDDFNSLVKKPVAKKKTVARKPVDRSKLPARVALNLELEELLKRADALGFELDLTKPKGLLKPKAVK